MHPPRPAKHSKQAWQLAPPAALSRAQGCGLPSMLQSKLNAPRVLRVNKVADYIVKKMGDQGVALREEPLFWDPAKQAEWEAQQAAEAAQQSAGAGAGVAAAPPEGPDRGTPAGGGGGSNNSSRFSIRQLYGGGSTAQQGAAAGQQTQGELPLLITCNGTVSQLCGGRGCRRVPGGGLAAGW